MKKMLAFVLLFIAAAALAADPSPVVLTLELPHTSVLPGVPFDMTVIYKNVSDHPVAVGANATVTIQRLNGQPVRMERWAHVQEADNSRNFDLDARQTRIGTIRWEENWFYDDAAFTVPGTYDIWLELTGDPNEGDEGVTYVGPVHTAVARLTRIEPTGEDAEVWKRLQEAAGGKWPSHGFGSRATRENLAEEIIANQPHSEYYPYAVVLNHDQPHLPVARDAVARFHHSPAYPHVLLIAAIRANYEGKMAAQQHAPSAEVEKYFNLALSYGEDAVETGSFVVTEHARIIIDGTRFDMEQFHRARAQQY